MTPAEIKKLHPEHVAPKKETVAPEPAVPDTAGPLKVEALQTSMTALGSAEAGTLHSTQSALGNVSVGGDADVSTSVVGMVSAKGTAVVRQGFSAAVMSEGDATITQGGGGLIIAKKIGIDSGGGLAMVAGEADVKKSYVGLLLARKTTLSEDSRVLFDWKAALILAVVLLGGVGIVVLVLFLIGRAIVGRLHRIADHLPHMPQLPHMDIPGWVRTIARMRRAA
ncbi:MAG TPA: hypothetical protein VF902_00205 [Coriobacteriia bacterium]